MQWHSQAGFGANRSSVVGFGGRGGLLRGFPQRPPGVTSLTSGTALAPSGVTEAGIEASTWILGGFKGDKLPRVFIPPPGAEGSSGGAPTTPQLLLVWVGSTAAKSQFPTPKTSAGKRVESWEPGPTFPNPSFPKSQGPHRTEPSQTANNQPRTP